MQYLILIIRKKNTKRLLRMFPTLTLTTILPINRPPDDYDTFDNFQPPITPLSFTSSTSSLTSQVRSTYHSIIEDNNTYINNEVQSYIKDIFREGRGSNSQRVINNYSLKERLGKGQFGKVYKAVSSSDENKVVAIKVIPKSPMNNQQFSMNQVLRQLQTWKNKGLIPYSNYISSDQTIMLMNLQKCKWELFILSRLNHPSISQFIECLDSPTSKSIWFVSDWSDLGELRWNREFINETLPQWDPFFSDLSNKSPKVFTKLVLLDIAEGLKYLESQECIHRDIKPSNILVDSIRKKFKISDFGCSIITPKKLAIDNPSFQNCFQAELNKIVGTPAFIAPELCFSNDPNSRSDIQNGFQLDMWSFGITLFCLLYNKLPFYGENEFDTYKLISNQSLHSNSNADYLDKLVIENMLEKDPQKRIHIAEFHCEVQKRFTKDILNSVGNIPQKMGSKKSVKNFFTKFRGFKTHKTNKNQKIKKTSKGPDSLQDMIVIPMPPERQYDAVLPIKDPEELYPPTSAESAFESSGGSSSVSSSFDEPVKVTDFLDRISYGDSHDDIQNKEKRLEMQEPVEHCVVETPEKLRKLDNNSSVISLIDLSPTKLPIGIDYSPSFSKIEELLPSLTLIDRSPIKKLPNITVSRGLAHSKNIMDFKNFWQEEIPERDSNL